MLSIQLLGTDKLINYAYSQMKEASMLAHRASAHPQMIQHFIFYFKNKLLNSNKKRSIPNHLRLHGRAIGALLTSSRQWEKKFSRFKALHECFIKITLFLRAKILLFIEI